MSWLRDHCPRLALARDQHLQAAEDERERQRILCDAELRWQAIVAHRELQLLRAGMTGDRRYVSRRAHKLNRAQVTLAEIQRQRETPPADVSDGSRRARERRAGLGVRNGRRPEMAA